MATRYGFNAGPQGPPGNSTGPAGGDLGGTFPTPDVLRIHGTTVPDSPAFGQTLVATTGTSSTWQIPSGMYPTTGLIGGCNMTINGTNPLAFDITAGTGYIVDYHTDYANPTVVKVDIAAQTITLSGAELTRAVSWWVANSSGVITSLDHQPTHDERRSLIQLGVTGLVGTSLKAVIASPAYAPQSANSLYDLMYSLGSFVVSGARVSANGANLNINLSSGVMYTPSFNYGHNVLDPNTYDVLASTANSFYYATRNINSSVLATSIDPTSYDNLGVITAVNGGSNSATIQRVYLFATGNAATQLSIQYGQSVYANLSDAVAHVGKNPQFVINPDFVSGNGVLIAHICMTRIATSLQDTANVAIIPAGKFAIP